jgi:GDP-L-fucose synthase
LAEDLGVRLKISYTLYKLGRGAVISIYIVGHKGMVGQAVYRLATAQGREVITAERSDLNITNLHEVETFLNRNRPSSVILAAARVGGIYANMTHKREYLTENLAIQEAVIEGARNAEIEKLVFLGSSCIYPKLAPQPISEESLLTGPLEETNEAYALAKIAGVKLCEYIRAESNKEYFSLMPTNLYGPGDNFDLKNSHVPAALMRRFHEAKNNGLPQVKIWGSGSPLREFMHVDDLADAILFAHDNPPAENLINVGSGTEISIRDFALLMKEVVSFQGALEFDTAMPDGTPRKLLDTNKLFNMGWRPRISLQEGLESTYKWFTNNLATGTVRGYAK